MLEVSVIPCGPDEIKRASFFSKPLVLSVITVLGFWLNRFLVVTFVRLWPLIVLDMAARAPFEAVLNASGIRMPQEAFQIIVAIGQVAVCFLSWKLVLKAYAACRRKSAQRKDSIIGSVGECGESRVRKFQIKRIPLYVLLVLGLLIINRCGRDAAGIFSHLTGLPPYPLRVDTEITVNRDVTDWSRSNWGMWATRDESIHRPPMIAFSGGRPASSGFSHPAEDVWEMISSPHGYRFSLSSGGSDSDKPKNVIGNREWIKDTVAVMFDGGSEDPSIESSDSIARRRRIIRGGPDPDLIRQNIEILLEEAEGGWWRERAGGYVISMNPSLSPDHSFEGLEARFPPCLFCAENVADAVRFFGELTGVVIILEVARAEDSKAKPASNEASVVRVNLGREVSLNEMMEEIALSQTLVSEILDGRIRLRALRTEDVGPRIKRLMDVRRSSTSYSLPDKTLDLFPPGSAEIVTEYLDDRDERIIEYAVDVLKRVGLAHARPILMRMLETGRTPSGLELTRLLRRTIASTLLRCGERAALAFLEAEGEIDRFNVSMWYDERVNIESVPEEVDIQRQLMAVFKRGSPCVRPGRIRVKELPVGMTQADAAAVERLALDFMNAFSALYWEDRAKARLTFSPDGRTASYSLELSHDWGPLAAGASEEYAILVKVGERWLIVECDSGYSWIS